jgi:hypothetical protein
MFGRRRPSPSSDAHDAITEFWRWWAVARHRVAAAFEADGARATADETSERVHAIDSGLQWELTPGRGARHALVVSPVGSPRLRRVVAQWLAAAPPADPTWEYHGSRQPDPNVVAMRLLIDDHDVDLGGLKFGVTMDADRACADILVFHPAFSAMDPADRLRIAIMSLGWLLGEDRVEAWVGAIEVATAAPADAVDSVALVITVDELAEKYREPQWVVMSGTRNDAPLTAVAQRPLKAIRWPRFDTHVAVTLRYDDRGNGFPTNASRGRLRAVEDYLADVIGSHGELLAHETGGGTHTLHFYVDGTTDAAARISSGVKTFKGKAEAAYDPDLARVEHLA